MQVVTIVDVAREAGTSQGTVSQVLRGKAKAGRISPALTNRVLETAKRLGYRRDDMASAMIVGKANASCLLIPSSFSEYAGRLLDGMLRESRDGEHAIKVIHYEKGMTPDMVTSFCLRQRLRGLVAFSMTDADFMDVLSRRLIEHEIMLVIPGANVSHIQCGIRLAPDNYSGGEKIFRHLYGLGHRRFLLGHNYCGMEWAKLRADGFTAAAEEAGIDPARIMQVKTKDAFYREDSSLVAPVALRKIFSGANAPTAIFALNDSAALNLLSRLQGIGVNVPGDVAVAGYGNSSFTQYTRPGLSSVDDHLERTGRRCVRLIMEHSGKGGDFSQLQWHESVEVEVVARASTVPTGGTSRPVS